MSGVERATLSWRIIAKSLKSKDMRKRLAIVFGMVLVYRLLAHIPIPLTDPTQLKQILDNLVTSSQTSQGLGFFNILSGGAFSTLAITLVGIGPYISSSVIMQLLTKALPKLEAMSNEGEFGRRKINQYTRIITLPLAIIQSIAVIFIVRQTAEQLGGVSLGAISAHQWLLMVSALSAVSMILMWLGELITEQGVVGQGISLIVTVGIVSGLPGIIGNLVSSVVDNSDKITLWGKQLPISPVGLVYAGVIAVLSLILTIFVVKLNEAQRKLDIHYAKRVQGNRIYGGVYSELPIKLISAGVIPFIFAQAFLAIPELLGRVLQSTSNVSWQTTGARMLELFQYPDASSFARPGWEPYVYPAVYFAMIFVFTFFYTNVVFNAKELAENLQKQGGFIPDVRAGTQTEKYLSAVVNRLNLFGATALGILAVMPFFLQWFFLKFFNITINQISITGTSILILVAVALETLRQIESRALMVAFEEREYNFDRLSSGPKANDVAVSKNAGRKGFKKLFTKRG